jgi:hypothetical protein
MTVARDLEVIEIKNDLIELPTTFNIDAFYKSNDWKLDLGFPTLDRMLGGLMPGEVSVIPEGTILGGVWETWIAINTALKRGCPTLFYTALSRTSLTESIAFELSQLCIDEGIPNTATMRHVRYLEIKEVLEEVPLEQNYQSLTLEELEESIHEASFRGVRGRWAPKLVVIQDIEDIDVKYDCSNETYKSVREEKCLSALGLLKNLAKLYEIHIMITKKPIPIGRWKLCRKVDKLVEFDELLVNVPGRSRFPDLIDDDFREVRILKNTGGRTGDSPICFVYDKHGLREGFSELVDEKHTSGLKILLDSLRLSIVRAMLWS